MESMLTVNAMPHCDSSHTTHDEESGIKFSPPLYQQRYHRVYEILKKESVSSVVDFGCAECRSLKLFKDLPMLERLIGVDLDDALLKKYHDRVRPLIANYLFRRAKRLVVNVLHGDLLEWDNRLEGVDAVTMIEVIEHLFQDGVRRLPHTLFGVIHPKLVIITTPNEEFNVLFPELVGFRHPDHKFEWTRCQFSKWCYQVCERYGYSVEYDGVGEAPDGSKHLGFCSQIGIFRRLSAATDHLARIELSPYVQIAEYEYPGETAGLTAESKLQHSVVYYVRLLGRLAEEERLNSDSKSSQHSDADTGQDGGGNEVAEVEEEGVYCFCLSKFMAFRKLSEECNGDLDVLRNALTGAGYNLTSDRMSVICPIENFNQSNSRYYDDDEDDLLTDVEFENSCKIRNEYKSSEPCNDEMDEEFWG